MIIITAARFWWRVYPRPADRVYVIPVERDPGMGWFLAELIKVQPEGKLLLVRPIWTERPQYKLGPFWVDYKIVHRFKNLKAAVAVLRREMSLQRMV